jgi:pimeloyl-ACP methyl ester carboxylesterase
MGTFISGRLGRQRFGHCPEVCLLEATMSDKSTSETGSGPSWFDWAVSAVNGIVGDHLHDSDNGLAIRMGFYADGRLVDLEHRTLALVQPAPTRRICVLVHGLGCNESYWLFHDPAESETSTSYGQLLQADLGYTPFFVRYNSGRSINANGRALADLIGKLVEQYPVPLDEIVLIGHSMGGLVMRSACHVAVQDQAAWVLRVSRLFYLGTPHTGADLARMAHAASETLAAVPNSVTRLISQILNLRSQGLHDLSNGATLQSVDEAGALLLQPVPWLATAGHYIVSGTMTQDPNHPVSVLLGDGLVRPIASSAATSTAGIWETDSPPPVEVMVFPGIHHLALGHDRRVYEQIRSWCCEG